MKILVIYTDGTKREMTFETMAQAISYLVSEGDHVLDYAVLDKQEKM